MKPIVTLLSDFFNFRRRSIENEGNENAKTSVFFRGLSYAPERQEVYDLASPCSSAVKDKMQD
ncbi:hypothetical protein [Cardinium endosymbiont of Tipula unca]|uniref:hypothetical protein n=1 Tax=Cardinium endosymbiont of Tipula unca TaxID=3066216 RepID=UPI0030CE2E8D